MGLTLAQLLTFAISLLGLGAIALPAFNKQETPDIEKAKIDLQRAVDRLSDEYVKWRAIVDAKAELDRVFVHQTLFGNMKQKSVVLFQKCFLGQCGSQLQPFHVRTRSAAEGACACVAENDFERVNAIKELNEKQILAESVPSNIRVASVKRSETSLPLNKATNFTYVPPPSTDITPQLIAQSLAMQPQDTATISSIIPAFQNGTISFGVQFNGEVAATVTLKASIDIPCDGIGHDPQPDLELRPKDIDNGTAQVVIPECAIIAVNMYTKDVVNYWVQNRNGSIFSLVGSNKLVNVNLLNSTASVALVLRAKPKSIQKYDHTVLEERTDFQTIARRALEGKAYAQPNSHTATMTPAACAAITCNNNGGNAALFNPFTKTCACRDPVYAETDHSS